MDGRRQIRRYVPELDAEGVQDLPPEDLRRFAFKMATGSGKTWVMAMAVVWSLLPQEAGAGLGALDQLPDRRAERHRLPAAGEGLRQQPHLPRAAAGPAGVARRLRAEGDPARRGRRAGPLGQPLPHQHPPALRVARPGVDAAERRRGAARQEAAKDLAASASARCWSGSSRSRTSWSSTTRRTTSTTRTWPGASRCWRSIARCPRAWRSGSTSRPRPRTRTGCTSPGPSATTRWPRRWRTASSRRRSSSPRRTTPSSRRTIRRASPRTTSREKYGYWLRAAVQRWKEHCSVYKKLGTKPVLFIMAEKNVYADAIGEYLWKTKEFGFKEAEVLVIHTDTAGEITKGDLEKAREAARDIDKPESKIKAIVSVMMLREGWDVRNVTVVLGLRPFTAKAEILPEQVIGRGLRLMPQVSPDRTQTLEVLGTRNLLNVLRDQLEAEGVGVAATTSRPAAARHHPGAGALGFDIAIPITKPRLVHDIRKLSDWMSRRSGPSSSRRSSHEVLRVKLDAEFATTETEVHQVDIGAGELPVPQELLGSITNKVIAERRAAEPVRRALPVGAGLRGHPLLRPDVDLEERRHSLTPLAARDPGGHRQVPRPQDRRADHRAPCHRVRAGGLQALETKPFSWRRNLPPLEAKKTVFNYVATYNDFEAVRRVPRQQGHRRAALRRARHHGAGRVRHAVPGGLPEAERRDRLLLTRTGWWCRRRRRARSTGSSRRRVASGRAPGPRTRRSRLVSAGLGANWRCLAIPADQPG